MQNPNTPHAFRRIAAAAVAAAMSILLVASASPSAWATSASQHESKAQEYAESSSEKQAEADDLRQDIDALQTKINDASAAYEAALSEHDAAVAAVEDAEARMLAAEDRIDELQVRLGSRAVSMYKSGGEMSIVDVLLGAKSFDSFLKSWDAAMRVADQDARWVEETKQSRIAAYEACMESIEQRKVAEDKVKEAEAAKAELDASQATMQETLAKVNEEIATLNALQEEEEMAAEEARRREEEAARLAAQKFGNSAGGNSAGGGSSVSAPAASGGWTHPLQSWRVSSEYGSRTDPISGKVSAYHSGIDLAVPLGTPVLAAKSGTVSYVGWYGTGGNAVIVNHGDGVRTVYMHLNGFNTTKGATVQAGECIAFVGTTGRSTGPHLHFNVEINNTPVNPRTVLSF